MVTLQVETVKRVSRTSTLTAAMVHPCLSLLKEPMFWLADWKRYLNGITFSSQDSVLNAGSGGNSYNISCGEMVHVDVAEKKLEGIHLNLIQRNYIYDTGRHLEWKNGNLSIRIWYMEPSKAIVYVPSLETGQWQQLQILYNMLFIKSGIHGK